MNEKISFQSISDALVRKTGVSKKAADTFSKAFFDTIVESLSRGEDSVKVKGLGTFKLVTVESRESVNVSNGERIVIPGYKKVSFTPEDAVVEFLNKGKEMEKAEESIAEEILPAQEEAPVVEEKDPVNELIQVPEPTHVEEKQDEFAGIDLLISTPESVEEVRMQYEDAKEKMETAVEEARKANAEKVRLEKLLERLEKNMQPELEAMGTVAGNGTTHLEEVKNEEEPKVAPLAVQDKKEETETVEQDIAESKRQEAFNRVVNSEGKAEEKPRKGGKGFMRFWLVTFIVLLLAAIVFFLYKTFRNIEAVEKVPAIEQPAKPKPAPKAKKETKNTADGTKSASGVKNDSVKADEKQHPQQPAVEEKPARPTTHVMRRGESLTRISQLYYGTKDSVRAIIRVNTFNDPNNVPVGAVVKLP
ncbi:MAG: HU family DNA-binding protein [Bacteroidaceae bacterium]|nr:HU family DNA-binding protein [Bacteroidaceae bacterium]